jgi:hypothetical protein
MASAHAELTTQEKPNLSEEPVGSRLMLQEQVVLALKDDEPGARNASCQLAARLDWSY